MRYLKVDLVPTLGVLGQRVVGEEHVLVTCLTSAKCFVFFPSSAFNFFLKQVLKTILAGYIITFLSTYL